MFVLLDKGFEPTICVLFGRLFICSPVIPGLKSEMPDTPVAGKGCLFTAGTTFAFSVFMGVLRLRLAVGVAARIEEPLARGVAGAAGSGRN